MFNSKVAETRNESGLDQSEIGELVFTFQPSLTFTWVFTVKRAETDLVRDCQIFEHTTSLLSRLSSNFLGFNF